MLRASLYGGKTMAKLRKCKLSWKPSASDHVTGYKLYWNKGKQPDYDSPCIDLGNVSEAQLPDVLKALPLLDEPIMFGIAAVDSHGNESDIAFLSEPYHLMAPAAPADVALTVMDTYQVVATDQDALAKFEEMFDEDTSRDPAEKPSQQNKPLVGLAPPESKIKYYDDVGFRKLAIEKNNSTQ